MPEKSSLQNRIMTRQIIKNSIHEVTPTDVTIVRVFFSRPQTIQKLLQIVMDDVSLQVVNCMNGRKYLRSDHSVGSADLIVHTADGRIFDVEFNESNARTAHTLYIHVGNLADNLYVSDSLLQKEIKAMCIVFASNVPYDLKESEPVRNGFAIRFITPDSKNTNTGLGILYHDLYESDPKKMLIPEFKQRAMELKMTEGGRLVMEMTLRDYIDELLKQNATVEEERTADRKRFEEERSMDRKNYEEIKERYEAERNSLKTVVFNLIQMNWTDEQIVSRLGLSQNKLDAIREELKLSLS